MKHLISIDPSINNCGVAVFENKKLKDYFLLKSNRSNDYLEKCRYMVSNIDKLYGKLCNCQLVIEIPQHFGSSVERGFLGRESGSIYKLTFLCGMLYNIDDTVVGYTPNQWKGQLPKDVTARRLQKYYPKHKFIILKDKDVKFIVDHNVLDAIAIGHYYLFKKI